MIIAMKVGRIKLQASLPSTEQTECKLGGELLGGD